MAFQSNPSPASPSNPTFLDTDPYPSTRDGRPMSSGSTATSATSDFGTDEARSARDRTGHIPAVTGPVGEPGLPPSRPTSIGLDPGRRGSLQPPTARKPQSRPTTGKTHVPSLAAQAVFRPMSSSKLQAQRNKAANAADGPEEAGLGAAAQGQPKHARRYSNASVNTLKELQAMRRDEEVPPVPASRDTQITNDGQHTTGNSVNSATPLYTRQQEDRREHDAGQLNANNNQIADLRAKSPRGFRASLGMGSRTNSHLNQENRPAPGVHEKLGSQPTTPNHFDQKGAAISRQTKAAGKNYEYFAGNMLFCLSGRCLNTRAQPINILTFILTTAPAALFGAFSAPWLWLHISPALPILFAYIFFITISAFIHAAVSDPGILPRNLHPHPPNPAEDRDPLTVGPATTEWVMVKSFPSSHRSPLPNRPNDASAENGAGAAGPTTAMEVPTKYCKTCNIWRPPRTHHCRVCDACIDTQDHHCVWLNNCVGRRNYKYFFAYVGFGSLLGLMLIVFSIIHVVYYGIDHNISFVDSLTGRTQERVGFAMFLVGILLLPYPGSLFTYHTFLIMRGETTREYLNSHKFMKKDRHRPFAQSSSIRNWLAVLNRPRPPTYLQFKHAYQPGDVRLGHAKPKQQRKKELKGRYSVPPNGAGMNGNGNGTARATDVEMKQFSSDVLDSGSGAKPQARNAGGAVAPVNRTPR